MLEKEDEKLRKELAEKIKKALSTLPRGGKARIALLCGKTPQAVTGWENSGKISFFQMCVVAKETNLSLEYFAPCEKALSKDVNEPTVYYKNNSNNTALVENAEEALLKIYRKLLPSQCKKLIDYANLLALDADQLRSEQLELFSKE
jgi:hypothetical protein